MTLTEENKKLKRERDELIKEKLKLDIMIEVIPRVNELSNGVNKLVIVIYKAIKALSVVVESIASDHVYRIQELEKRMEQQEHELTLLRGKHLDKEQMEDG